MSDIWLTQVGAREIMIVIEGDNQRCIFSGKLIINSETISGMNKWYIQVQYIYVNEKTRRIIKPLSISAVKQLLFVSRNNKNKLLVWEERAINKQWIGKAFLP